MLVAPQIQTVSGPSVSVEVQVAGMHDLGTYSFELSWDDSVLSFDNISNGPFLGSTGRTVTCDPPIVSSNSLSFTCLTAGAEAGPDGSGVIANLEFDVVGSGITPLILSGAKVISTQGEITIANSNNSLVIVQ